jgi:hypothetical protein
MSQFNFDEIRSVEFGVCLDAGQGESYRLVPCVEEVQDALREMLAATAANFSGADSIVEEFSPAEKYGATERLTIRLSSEWVTKHKEIFAASNFPTDTAALSEVNEVVSYFAVFRDANRRKLMAFRRAMQFKGVLKKKLLRFADDALRIIPDEVFKLDADFDFLIFDEKILIWRPSGFVFTADMDQHIAACAMGNVDRIAEDITCVDFEELKGFVSGHKLAMRLVAALKSRQDLAAVSAKRLRAECKESGVKVVEKNGKLMPAEGSEMGFLMLLDRRRYTVTLVEKQPETYEAASRHGATRADQP